MADVTKRSTSSRTGPPTEAEYTDAMRRHGTPDFTDADALTVVAWHEAGGADGWLKRSVADG